MAVDAKNEDPEDEGPKVIEICAGAGGQALGLHLAGFHHELAVELDETACMTLRANKPKWDVRQGDVADQNVWKPDDYAGKDIALFAGGVPCPPFSIAGKQLGANDERDLFAWAIEQVDVIQPRAVMLENVRGLSMPRFAGYRQHVLDRLAQFGYLAEWKLIQAADYGVPQLRPRFILVALRPGDAPFFHWPARVEPEKYVGDVLYDLIKENGWPGAKAWRKKAKKIAPTIVGGSKKHGGADLGPSRAKEAWKLLAVDAMGIADAAPPKTFPYDGRPKLTTEMVARLQGWSGDGSRLDGGDYAWSFEGRKTSKYRQIGNAFPPPVAKLMGEAIMAALDHTAPKRDLTTSEHDPLYRALRATEGHIGGERLLRVIDTDDQAELERRMNLLMRDFEVDVKTSGSRTSYRLGGFKAFVGQDDHVRHSLFQENRARIS